MRSVDESVIGSAKVLPPKVPMGTLGGRTFFRSGFRRRWRQNPGGMGQVAFYGVREDLTALLTFLFDETDTPCVFLDE
jgi:hypothetical protein